MDKLCFWSGLIKELKELMKWYMRLKEWYLWVKYILDNIISFWQQLSWRLSFLFQLGLCRQLTWPWQLFRLQGRPSFSSLFLRSSWWFRRPSWLWCGRIHNNIYPNVEPCRFLVRKLDRSFSVELRFPCLNNQRFTINSVEGVDRKLDSLVNMFIFLFSGVDFLLLFLFSSVEVASDVDVDVFGEEF